MTERTEERLRAALRAEAEIVDVDPEAWDDVQRRVRAHRPRHVGRAAMALAAAAVIALAVGLGAMLTRDDAAVDLVPADSTTTTASTTVPAEPLLFAGIWPFTSQSAVDAYVASPGVGMFFDPEQTALEFAREYLDMPDPASAGSASTGTDGRHQTITVHPSDLPQLATEVHVERAGDDGPWSVIGTTTHNIQVGAPATGDAVGGTFHVSGTSTAFEANVNVEVRDDGGRSLVTTFVMGGANGELAPFEGTVTIDDPAVPAGAIIFKTLSAKDGSVQEAAVVRIRFAAVADTTYSVFFHRGEQLVEVPRHGPGTTGVLRQALEALVAGPRPDDGDGLTSFFSDATAGVLAGVNLRDGTAIVDLSAMVDNASTSTGSALFLQELDATVFQFPTVQRVEYRLHGSCDDFWTWLQYGTCRVIERPAQ